MFSLLRAWAVTIVASVLLHGAKLGIQGAFVGSGKWVQQVGRAADASAQLASFGSGVLLVYLGLSTVRTARNPFLGILAALLGAAPTAILFLSQKYQLNQSLGFYAALFTGMTMCLCAHQSSRLNDVRRILFLGGLVLVVTCLRLTLERAAALHMGWSQSLGALEHALRWAVLVLVALRALRRRERSHVSRALLLFAPLVLAAASIAAREPHPTGPWLLVGRSLALLSPIDGSLGIFGLSSAMTLAFAGLTSPLSLTQLCCSMIALGLFSATTPLACAWLTCISFAVVLVSWDPTRTFSPGALRSNR